MPLFGEELVTRTKFIVPAPRRAHLDRARLHARLGEISRARLALVIAGAGYGKSSLLAGHIRAHDQAALWYELAERDADPQAFAVHLAHLAHRAYPGSAARALALLAAAGGAERHGEAAIEALADALLDRLEADTWLVLDDYHRIDGSGAAPLLNHLIRHAPPRLHIVLAARSAPDLPDLPRWRLAGDVVTLAQADLAFQPAELAAWLRDVHGLDLAEEALVQLATETEGWPMALPLVVEQLRGDRPALAHAGTRQDLFDYLARESLAALAPAQREFLLATAPLERLEPGVCGTLAELAGPEAGAMLRALHDRGLFLIPLGAGHHRHHHLVRELLLARLAAEGRLGGARRAAARALAAHGEPEDAIAQLLANGDLEPACAMMALVAPDLVDQGRGLQLAAWAQALPPALLDRAPALAVCLGDASRLAARFDEALAWYERARRGYGESAEGRSRALAGMALVYLDTARPALAEPHLEEALAAADDPRRRAELLVMLAENKLNRGDAAGALALYERVRGELAQGWLEPDGAATGPAAWPEVAENEGRLHLRTGNLAEARRILAAAAAQDEADDTPTRSHREPHLVLAFVAALTGDVEAATRAAEAGLARARRQQAAWAEAVGLMRRGHARLVGGDAAGAAGDDAAALAQADAIGVARLRAEPLFGRALLAARAGDMGGAERQTTQALAVTESTGDGWVAALAAMAFASGLAGAGDPRAEQWIARARAGFETCGDGFGLACSALAAARLALALGDDGALAEHARELAERVRRGGYGFLLGGPTLMGFPDAAAARAFVAGAVGRGIPAALLTAPEAEAAEAALPAAAEPALRERALGEFRVWRGADELGERAWGREKARQLFHLLLAHRGQALPKARIIDQLWPDAGPTTADGTFRVALNALNKALEPDRAAGAPPRFVVKRGSGYGLAGAADIWLDAGELERGLDAAAALEAAGDDGDTLADTYRRALALYEGPFLKDFTAHEAWCDRERDRLAHRFADGALRLARLLARRGDDAGCAEWAGRLLALDPLAEEAYRLLMAAQYRQGDRAQALKTYDRCVITLSDELDVDPMPETQRLAGRIEKLEPVTP